MEACTRVPILDRRVDVAKVDSISFSDMSAVSITRSEIVFGDFDDLELELLDLERDLEGDELDDLERDELDLERDELDLDRDLEGDELDDLDRDLEGDELDELDFLGKTICCSGFSTGVSMFSINLLMFPKVEVFTCAFTALLSNNSSI